MNGEGGDEDVAGAVSSAPPPLDWKFSQVFGERTAGEEVQEVDIISAIEFDKSGDHLATGDRGGRVVLFERTDAKEQGSRRDLERQDHSISRHPEFRYKTEFQSHEPEFDYLKSLEIEEKINKIRWCQTSNSSLFLLSTNDKTIKFWKVQEKKVKRVSQMNVDPSQSSGNGYVPRSSTSNPRLCLPNGGCSERPYKHLSNEFKFPPGGFPTLRLPVVVSSEETSLNARCRRVYAHAHDYHINSISKNSDGETFISADDLRINLWNLEISNQSFNIVDVKPANMEDLTEVITSAEFHPVQCNTLAYCSSKGSIRLIDLRQSALCDNHSKLFEEHETPGSRSFFTEIIASISDIKFSKDGRHILSRDYMTLKLWDINMDSGPAATYQVHEYLRPKLCDLYENDSIFDKFECCLSGDGLRVASGSYSNLFRVFGCASGSTEATTLEASKNPMRRQVQTPARPSRSLTSLTRVVRRAATLTQSNNGSSFQVPIPPLKGENVSIATEGKLITAFLIFFFLQPTYFCSQFPHLFNVQLVAELMGTFIMMFLGCGSVFIDKRLDITFVGVAFTWTAAVVAMGYTFGHISGCHINPAVTIGFASGRQFPWKQVPFYITAQVTGAIAACLMLSWLFNGEETSLLLTLPGGPNPVSNTQAVAWEIVISSILMFVIRSAGTDPRACTQVGGIAVGAVLFSNVIVAGKITGASMNPARSLGPAIVAKNFNKIWIYLISPVIGTVTGSMIYNFFKIQMFVEDEKISTETLPETNRRATALENSFIQV